MQLIFRDNYELGTLVVSSGSDSDEGDTAQPHGPHVRLHLLSWILVNLTTI